MSPPPPRRTPSLRQQILRRLVPLHLVVAIASGLISYAVYRDLIEDFMATQMRVLAESYARDLAQPVALAPLSAADIHQRGQFVVQVWSPEGLLVASSAPGLRLARLERPGLQGARSADGQDWRAHAVPAGRSTWGVQVLQSKTFLRHEITTRTLFAIGPIALLVPLLLWVLWRVVNQSSAGLRALAGEVAARDEHRLDPIALERVPQEIVPLVASFNGLLRRLTQAFEGQRRFVQDAAHELRTPIAAMQLQIDNLRERQAPPPGEDPLDRLHAGVGRAAHLVDQLLRLSVQEDAARAAPAEPVDLLALVRESVGQCMALADRRRIEVGFEGAPCAPLRGVPADLRSVFDSLLDNALRYTPEGGQVEVRLRERAGEALIEIEDDGPGIEPALRERVFDRFFRVPGSGVAGSGLGLSIARAAAQRQGLGLELLAREDGRTGLLARIRLPRAGDGAGPRASLTLG